MFTNSPHYVSRNNSANLVDIVRDNYDSFIDKFTYATKVSYSSVIDDLDLIYLGKPVDTIIKKTGKILDKTKDLNVPLIKATGLSVAANVAISYLFKDYNVGYAAESLTYTPVFTYVYWKANKNLGVSNARIAVDLSVLGVTTFLLSVGPYRIGRNELIGSIVQNNYLESISDSDLLRATAAGMAQVALMPFFALILNPVKKGVDYIDNKFNFKNRLVYVAEKFNDSTNKI